MSLIDAMMEKCVLIEKEKKPDGAGGFISSWKDGAEFLAVITMDTTMEAMIAQKQGMTSVYTVTTKRATELEYHEVFRRVRDGKIFRVTSDGNDKLSPAASSLDMRQVTAERWELTQ